MKERPIIFSSEMVRAILEGRKSQTRRVIKPQPVLHNTCTGQDFEWKGFWDKSSKLDTYGRYCPYGQAGDRLWVRESWWADDADQLVIFYVATDQRSDIPLKPSIHMPRGFSRIMLEITDIRVERVQEISVYDALKEGMNPYSVENKFFTTTGETDAFAKLWDSINARRGYSWAVNPWVWVIEFKQVPQ